MVLIWKINITNVKGMMHIGNLLEPTVDYVFKRIFGHIGSEKITSKFLSDILDEKIENVNLDCNTFLDKDITDDKVRILDVKVKFKDGVTCDLEMQVVGKNYIYNRILFYWSKLYAQNIKTGNDYQNLKRCIAVLITDFELNNLSDIPQYLTKWQIKEKKYGQYVLTDLMEICIIELPKVERYKENGEIDNWVEFIKNPEVIDMSDKKTNDAIKEAKKVLIEISNDEHERELADLRQKYIMDQKAIEDRGIEIGIERGIEKGIEIGKEQGIQQGIQQGMQQGVQLGQKRAIEELAKKMLNENIEIEIIMKVTNLSKEEIVKLK